MGEARRDAPRTVERHLHARAVQDGGALHAPALAAPADVRGVAPGVAQDDAHAGGREPVRQPVRLHAPGDDQPQAVVPPRCSSPPRFRRPGPRGSSPGSPPGGAAAAPPCARRTPAPRPPRRTPPPRRGSRGSWPRRSRGVSGAPESSVHSRTAAAVSANTMLAGSRRTIVSRSRPGVLTTTPFPPTRLRVPGVTWMARHPDGRVHAVRREPRVDRGERVHLRHHRRDDLVVLHLPLEVADPVVGEGARDHGARQ